ncbi:MAG: hypothetical protein JW940_14660 [Polyangiaceae bacterium]|nr:hypothetical protein [Polyangiaceae bacterium]
MAPHQDGPELLRRVSLSRNPPFQIFPDGLADVSVWLSPVAALAALVFDPGVAELPWRERHGGVAPTHRQDHAARRGDDKNWPDSLRNFARLLQMSCEDAGMAELCFLLLCYSDGAEKRNESKEDLERFTHWVDELARAQEWHGGQFAVYGWPQAEIEASGVQYKDLVELLIRPGIASAGSLPQDERVDASKFVEGLIGLPGELQEGLRAAARETAATEKGENRTRALADTLQEWVKTVRRTKEQSTRKEGQQ